MTVDETTTPGEQLRDLRERLGLTIRDVENASNRVAARHQSSEYSVSLSRLSDIETKGVIPSIFKLYSLSVIYRKDIRELLSLYGVDVENTTDDIASVRPPRTHRLQALDDLNSVKMPVRLDPLFDLRTTDIVGRLIVKWGTVPLALLKQFELKRYSHAYIGTEDWTMYPLILPGSFVQIDESKTKVTKKLWRAEYQRPIYFVETREGFTCCWCELNGPILTLQPHPMSPSRTRALRLGSEVEIVGQVVGIAMQLDAWTSYESEPAGTQSGE